MSQAQPHSCLQWAHLSSGHPGCNRSFESFRELLYSRITCVELSACMRPILGSCGCHASGQRASRDRGLVSSLPIP